MFAEHKVRFIEKKKKKTRERKNILPRPGSNLLRDVSRETAAKAICPPERFYFYNRGQDALKQLFDTLASDIAKAV